MNYEDTRLYKEDIKRAELLAKRMNISDNYKNPNKLLDRIIELEELLETANNTVESLYNEIDMLKEENE